MRMSVNVIVISPKDNVAVATRDIKAGERVEGVNGGEIIARSDIPCAHKVALAEIPERGKIIKYGESIGVAGEKIHPGDYVHVHNLKAEDS
jgi:altronate hydrolase